MLGSLIGVVLALILLAVVVLCVLNGTFSSKSESERQEQTEDTLTADPYLAAEVERIGNMIIEMGVISVGNKDTMGDLRALAIQHDYHKLDDRFFDLYEKNIAQMSKSELYQELREIEQMAIDLKAQVGDIAELDAGLEAELGSEEVD